MINIRITTPQGDNFKVEVEAVPRIGEVVTVALSTYKVTNVIHTIGDRYTNSSIVVVLE